YRNDPEIYKTAAAKVGEFDFDTLEMQAEEPMREALRTFPEGRERGGRVWLASLDRADYTANDYTRLIERLSHAKPGAEASILLKLSPHSPLARASAIAYRWDLVEPRLDQWLREAASNRSEEHT